MSHDRMKNARLVVWLLNPSVELVRLSLRPEESCLAHGQLFSSKKKDKIRIIVNCPPQPCTQEKCLTRD